ncbi:hypothetical protein SASPL_127294 [Salvia splendens]|uniref:Uncharacterized protein n=1 Tax=Salvia splendens TaxID=180675 RepID=A0A8X8ZRI4_SALSN|nr:hypothetical protein SASPL_127294 [Salvia splendens]
MMLAMFMGFALWCYLTTNPKSISAMDHSTHPAVHTEASVEWWWPDVDDIVAKRHRRLQSCSVGCRCGCCGGICGACCEALNQNASV